MARPRKPTSRHQAEGTRMQQDRSREPRVHPPGMPEKPDDLSETQSKVWDEVVRVLDPNKVCTEEDFLSLMELVATAAELRDLRRYLNQFTVDERYTYETENEKTGTLMIRPRPECGLISDASRRLLPLLARFGLTPADRSKVKMIETPDEERAKDDEFSEAGSAKLRAVK